MLNSKNFNKQEDYMRVGQLSKHSFETVFSKVLLFVSTLAAELS